MRDTERADATERDPRWRAVRARDASADGTFYYAVMTTGVYCRPSCASRLARPENVSFHTTRVEAEREGFRPCKRCRPDASSSEEDNARRVEGLCRLIEASDEPPTLEMLAGHVGLSTFYTQRLFKAVTGVTPKAYATAHRAKRLRGALTTGRKTVTQAIYDAGYGSSGPFYAQAESLLGMKPSTYRGGGADLVIRFAIGECSLGAILVAATDRGVCAILLGDDPAALADDLERRFPRARLVVGDVEFEGLVATVVGLVEDPGAGVQLPLDIRGTAFQQRVWRALTQIPAGKTTTYAEIAEAIGAPKAVRAVGTACGANALAVAIPCHRVVRRDGELSGYRWGLERKRALLERESGR